MFTTCVHNCSNHCSPLTVVLFGARFIRPAIFVRFFFVNNAWRCAIETYGNSPIIPQVRSLRDIDFSINLSDSQYQCPLHSYYHKFWCSFIQNSVSFETETNVSYISSKHIPLFALHPSIAFPRYSTDAQTASIDLISVS